MSNSVLEEHNNSIKQFFSNKKKYTVILILEVLETQIKYESRQEQSFSNLTGNAKQTIDNDDNSFLANEMHKVEPILDI